MKAAMFMLASAVLSTPAICQDGNEPLRLHPQNPHYFLYEGKATVLVTSGEHYGSVIDSDFDFRKYLATLAKDGLNYTRLFGGSYVEVPGESFGIKRNTLAPKPGRLLLPWARSSQPGYAGGGNKFDLDRWNPEYFERLHSFLGEARQQGVVVEISLFSSQYGQAQWNESPFNAANNVNSTAAVDWKDVNTLENGNILAHQERYVRKLVREANAFPNVFFEIQNEPWSDHGVLADVINPYLPGPGRDQYPNSVDLPDNASMAWQKRVAEWINDEQAKLPRRHLIAQNVCNFRFPVRETLVGVSILNFHYAYPEAVTVNYGLEKALAYDETGFLGRTDEAYRRQAWNFMLAGGSTFDGLDYSFSPGHEDGADKEPNGPGGGSASLRKQLGILKKFLDALPLAELVPDDSIVVHAEGAVAHVLSNGKSVYALYLDGNGPSHLTLKLPAGTFRAAWIDPGTGAETAVPDIKSRNDAITLTSPSFANGIALRLDRLP